jgi:hypothetical protein
MFARWLEKVIPKTGARRVPERVRAEAGPMFLAIAQSHQPRKSPSPCMLVTSPLDKSKTASLSIAKCPIGAARKIWRSFPAISRVPTPLARRMRLIGRGHGLGQILWTGAGERNSTVASPMGFVACFSRLSQDTTLVIVSKRDILL